MNVRVVRLLIAVALLAGAGALVAWWLKPAGRPDPVVDATPGPLRPPEERPANRQEFAHATRGGTFGGVVVNQDGRPVRDADVLLVAVDGDAKTTVPVALSEGVVEDVEIPRFGDFKTAARGRTNAEGRFSLSAGDAVVVAIVAWERAYSPGMLAHTETERLLPGDFHEVRVLPAGWLVGKVVDSVTKEPVRAVEVAVYLQGISNVNRRGPDPFTATNSFARFQTYVARELGPMVWGLQPPPGDSGLRLWTDAAGSFRFGPVMSEVQVGIVLTHPNYKWTEHDPEVTLRGDLPRKPGEKPPSRVQRVVVPPGETVERTYELEKGHEVRGRVLDGEGKPIEGVSVFLEHVAQYAQHPWYRTHTRDAKTASDGSFRIAGLSYEPYNLRFTHPSFDTEHAHGVKAGSNQDYKFQAAGGWLDAVVEGGPSEPEAKAWTARVVLESLDGKQTRREERVTVLEGRFQVERLKPGDYDVQVISGTRISETARVAIEGSGGATVTVRMLGGGGARIPVQDASGSPIDPATVELEAMTASGPLRRAAFLVARRGLASAEGLLPGRYRARARAVGYEPAIGEPFEVLSDRTTGVPPLVLRRQGFVKITGVVGPDGRPFGGDVRLFLAQGDGEYQPRLALHAGLLPVLPGTVRLKAEASDGRGFETVVEVGEGTTVDVSIQIGK